jgi:hypothetical protein
VLAHFILLHMNVNFGQLFDFYNDINDSNSSNLKIHTTLLVFTFQKMRFAL